MQQLSSRLASSRLASSRLASSRLGRTIVLGLLALPLGSCGGSAAFRHTFPDNRAADLDDVSARLSGSPAPSAPALAVGVATSPVGLYAYDLAAGRVLWNEPAELGTVPHLAGAYLVSEEGDDAVVRRLDDGSIVQRIPRRGLRLVGAGGEGELGAVVLSTTGGAVAESQLVLLSAGGSVHRFQVDQALGEPAVRAGMVFVPWGHQNVSVLDGETGAELARLRVREVVGHAISRGDDVFIGQSSLSRFSSALTADPPWLEPSETERSSGAELFDDAYAPPPAPVSAAHHVRMAFAPHAADVPSGVELDGGVLYEVFYRAVFALEGPTVGGAPGDSARWATLTPADVVGISVDAAGIFVADEAGHLMLLETSDGRVSWSADTGIASSYVALRVEGFHPSSNPEGEVLPLRDQLLRVASDTDARLVPARAFSIRLLGASSDPEVTGNLVTLCEDRSLAPSVHTAACETLSRRSVGGDHVVAALGRHARFLEGTGAPPVGPLARAALAMGERRAVPLLLSQLVDPETPAGDLPALFSALSGFADPAALSPIAEWLRLYHAEPDDSPLGEALAAGARAYGALAGPTAADLLQPLLADPSTHASLREAAQAVLTPPSAEEPAAPSEAPEAAASPSSRRSRRVAARESDPSPVASDAGPVGPPPDEHERTPPPTVSLPLPTGEGRIAAEAARERAIAERAALARAAARAEEEGEDEEGGREEDDELPTHLTTEMIADTLRDFRVPLRECLVTPRLTHARARVVLVIEPTGALALVHVTPTELQSCVEPLIRSTPYPPFDGLRRQTVTYEIRR
jgi:hypothetical protein